MMVARTSSWAKGPFIFNTLARVTAFIESLIIRASIYNIIMLNSLDKTCMHQVIVPFLLLNSFICPSVCLSECPSQKLTWLISSGVLIIEHWYLACTVYANYFYDTLVIFFNFVITYTGWDLYPVIDLFPASRENTAVTVKIIPTSRPFPVFQIN